jgi:TolB-like protein
MSEIAGAVFLSYTSEDAAAAARICEGLRAAGIDVWFDQSELRGGDVWDHHIRSQIRDCALFIPIISTHTQSRSEGYFRLEWDLADQRSHMIVRSRAFIVPVCIDRTPDGGAEVPETFLKVQWTRLPDGVTTPAFCERIAKLLQGGEPAKRPLRSTPPTTGAAPQKSFPRRGAAIAAVVLVASVLGGLLWHRLQGAAELKPPAVPAVPAIAAASAAPEKSIAVLPFADMSEKRDQEYFSDGLSEELIDRLSHNPELKVIARTSSFAFKGKNEDIRTIARTLGVANLLEGSVRKSGSALKITAQLIRAADGVDLWSESYERQLTDVFKVQEEIAAAVVQGLQARLLPTSLKPDSAPRNMEAYSLYLRGHYFARRGSDADVDQGIATLKQAIALDPSYAPAHAELAQAYLFKRTFGTGADTLADWRRETDEALRLDPTLSSARNLRVSLAMMDWDWDAATKETDALLAAAPNDAEALARRAGLARARGELDQSLGYFQQALRLDPLSVIGHVQLAMLYSSMGRSSEARASAAAAIAINPVVTKAHLLIAIEDLNAGHIDAASAAVENESGEYYRLQGRSMVAFARKQLPESDAALNKLISAYGDTAGIQIAQGYAYRGEPDKAFKWLDLAATHKDAGLVWVKTDPLFAKLHADPRFSALLHRINLPES